MGRSSRCMCNIKKLKIAVCTTEKERKTSKYLVSIRHWGYEEESFYASSANRALAADVLLARKSRGWYEMFNYSYYSIHSSFIDVSMRARYTGWLFVILSLHQHDKPLVFAWCGRYAGVVEQSDPPHQP